ncbi:hypothetical protein [Streptomyces sp. NPDC058268]|uniref:hypothetical protein n=1 Tax=Streptomyces sp. NPDC058268 TaxID=3346413 RepID=UPI0036F11E50
MNFPHRSGPAAQAVSVKRMEPTAQAQLGPLGLTSVGWNRVTGWSGLGATGALYLLAGQVLASTWGRPVLPRGRFPAPDAPRVRPED